MNSEKLIVNSEKYQCFAFDVGAGPVSAQRNKYDTNPVGACIARPQEDKPNANPVGAESISAQIKSHHAITLIALIITIIIMLILAGVVLNLTLGEHGIFKTAQNASKNYILAEEREKNELNNLYKELGIELLPENTTNNEEQKNGEKVLSYTIKNNKENIVKKKYTQLSDLSGNSNIANLYNIDTVEEGDGIVFNGSSSYAELNLQQNLTFPLTIEFVLTPPPADYGGYIFSSPTVAFYLCGNEILCSGSTSNIRIVPEDFYDGNKKHIIATYNSATDFEVYINNVKLEKSSKTDYCALPSVTYLGRRHNGLYWKGTIYEFRIYNKALSESEINGTIDKSNLILEYNVKNDTNYVEEANLIKDMTNNNNNATGYNIEYNDTKDGIVFNGTSSYGEIALQQNLTFPLTIEFVLTPPPANYGGYIFSSPTVAFYLCGNEILCSGSTSNIRIVPEDFYDGNKKHIIATYNSATDFEVYINNVKLEKSSKTDYCALPSVTYLGRRHDGYYWKGTIYEFNIYSKALNENEIKIQYGKMQNNY